MWLLIQIFDTITFNDTLRYLMNLKVSLGNGLVKWVRVWRENLLKHTWSFFTLLTLTKCEQTIWWVLTCANCDGLFLFLVSHTIVLRWASRWLKLMGQSLSHLLQTNCMIGFSWWWEWLLSMIDGKRLVDLSHLGSCQSNAWLILYRFLVLILYSCFTKVKWWRNIDQDLIISS